MTGAEKLKEKILSDAGGEADQLLGAAKTRAAEIMARGEQQAEAKRKALLEQARLQAEERLRRARTIAGLEARKAILAAKEELIEDTFSQALARLQLLDREAYQGVVLPMLLAAAQSGNEEVIISPDDRERFTPDFLAKANKELAGRGKRGNLSLAAETRHMQGGFVLSAGELEINSSFDALLRMQREQLEPEVAAALFA
jgi:V/A-type H+-transporting ATPase subunit E